MHKILLLFTAVLCGYETFCLTLWDEYGMRTSYKIWTSEKGSYKGMEKNT
jgi:hypothetical protein